MLSSFFLLFHLIDYTGPFLLQFCCKLVNEWGVTCELDHVLLGDDKVVVDALYDLFDRL